MSGIVPFLTSWLRKVVCLCAKCKQKCHQRFPYSSVINKLSGEKNKQITAYIVITANKHGLKAKKDKQRITSNILLFVLYSFIPRSIINISLSRRVQEQWTGAPEIQPLITYRLSRLRSERFLIGCPLRGNIQNETNNQTDTLAIPLSIRNFRFKTSMSRAKKFSYKT